MQRLGTTGSARNTAALALEKQLNGGIEFTITWGSDGDRGGVAIASVAVTSVGHGGDTGQKGSEDYYGVHFDCCGVFELVRERLSKGKV